MRNQSGTFERADPTDWPQINALFLDAFHRIPDPAATEDDGHLFEPARSLILRRDSRIVAHTGSFRRELTIPGSIVPAAHVALVAVSPELRGRGLLTRLIHQQLAHLRDAGEPVAVLWSSRGRIYPRFGFGPTVARLALDIDTRDVTMTSPQNRRPTAMQAPSLLYGELSEADPLLRSVFEAVRAARPGWSGRDDRWWRYRALADHAGRRRGATPWHVVVHTTSDGPEGYAVWRVRQTWVDGSAAGVVEVREVVCRSAAAYQAVWRFLLSVDLTRTVRYPLASVDDPLFHLVDEPRQLGARLADALWLRIINLPAALTARRYAVPVDIVLDVADEVLTGNAGRWHLTADDGGASCSLTTAGADIRCHVRDLAAAYLGAATLPSRMDSGLITEMRAGAVTALHHALSWHRTPSVIEQF